MEHEETDPQTQEEGTLIYVVGAIIVVAVVVAAVLMWPKKKVTQTATPTPDNKQMVKPTLTKLVCENEWFNPVVGMPKYYLSAEGGDISKGVQVECTFTIIKEKETVLTETIKVSVTPAPDRGGTTFRCTTKALDKIPQNTPVTMTALVKNEDGMTSSCSGTVTFR